MDSRCQAPHIPPPQLEMSIGGSGLDMLWNVRELADGDFLLAGWSASMADTIKTAPLFGGGDFWLIRLGHDGGPIWDYSFGGTGDDLLASLDLAGADGFLLGGYSTSVAGGNKSSPNRGGADFWVVRASSNGELLWDQSYGGSDDDLLQDL